MLIERNLKWNVILHYTWKSMLYYLLLAIVVFLLHDYYQVFHLHLPFSTITALSTALAIFLGFKNNNAYDRWWEARKIWGLLVNFSRAWARQVITMIMDDNDQSAKEVTALQYRMIYRHIAFVHALRVFLRQSKAYNQTTQQEIYREANKYSDTQAFLPGSIFVFHVLLC
jgi:putative membrane protein